MKAEHLYTKLKAERQKPLWKLLASDNGVMILAILEEHFGEAEGPVPAYELYNRVERSLAALADRHEVPAGQSARAYVRDWLAQGYLTRTLPKGADEEVYGLTAASAEALRFVRNLESPQSEATESRLAIVIDSLARLEEETDDNVERRREKLRAQKALLMKQMAKLDAGNADVLPDDKALERVREILSLFEGLVGDFHRVKESFNDVNAQLRQRILSDNVLSRGDVLDEIFNGLDLIRESGPGKSFFAFWELLNSPEESSRLEAAVDGVLERDFAGKLTPEERRAIRFLRRRLIEKSGDVHETTTRLAKGLRNFVEKRDLREERLINDELKKAMHAALGTTGLSAIAATDVELPELGVKASSLWQLRPLDPTEETLPPPIEVAPEADVDLSAIGERVARSEIDFRELVRQIRTLTLERGQTSVADVLDQYPAREGMSTVIGLLELALKAGIPGDGRETLVWTGLDGVKRRATLQEYFFVKEKLDDLDRDARS